MSAQPLNSAITVYRAIRTYRDDRKLGSVAAIIKRLNPLLAAVPGNEIQVGVLSRDTSVSDCSPYMGQARFGAGRGFPIVVGLKDTISFKNAQENLAGVDFAFTIGGDKFLKSTAAALSGDLYGDAQDLVASNN